MAYHPELEGFLEADDHEVVVSAVREGNRAEYHVDEKEYFLSQHFAQILLGKNSEDFLKEWWYDLAQQPLLLAVGFTESSEELQEQLQAALYRIYVLHPIQ